MGSGWRGCGCRLMKCARFVVGGGRRVAIGVVTVLRVIL